MLLGVTRRILCLWGAMVGLLGAAGSAQPALTARDYDDFYTHVILKARNGTRAEWLASYDAVVDFIARVRKDIDALPEATRHALARAVHDNGYWKGQERRVRDPADPFLGARFTAGEASLAAVLTPQGYEAYRTRYAQGARGYRIALEAVADRAGLYRLEGKAVPRVAELPASTPILNGNAQGWDDLVADAHHYADPGERLRVIVLNQLNGVATTLALLRGSQPRSDAETDYAAAVIWRYTGHHSGRDGWEREPLVRTPYAELSEAEKAKDRDVGQAVREALAVR
jgi:hypothetical protein